MGGTVIKNNFSLTCMPMIDPTTDCFEISEALTFDLNEVADSSYDHIDKVIFQSESVSK